MVKEFIQVFLKGMIITSGNFLLNTRNFLVNSNEPGTVQFSDTTLNNWVIKRIPNINFQYYLPWYF